MDRRKELKMAYKETPPPMGVYQIRNKVNGKILVGSSMNLPGKFNSSSFQLNFNSYPIKELQGDWKIFGSDSFAFEILETLEYEKMPKENWRTAVSEMEEKWLNSLQPYCQKGYNKLKKE
ncbi:MAG: GIY-YIG nuclease family protein [Bacillota bacterium]